MYDPYRNLYYRIAGLPTNSVEKNASLQRYSVIILSANFEKLGEVRLEPVKEFLVKDWFVCKRGLCISTANFLNESIDENKMSFNLLVLDSLRNN
jgi:hypothetical protein